jgi:hypothetical protein
LLGHGASSAGVLEVAIITPRHVSKPLIQQLLIVSALPFYSFKKLRASPTSSNKHFRI